MIYTLMNSNNYTHEVDFFKDTNEFDKKTQ